MSPRKSVAQELSRDRILDEARELFSTFGYRDLTMRSIAKEMGYSHGALYYHFHDKAELFSALVKEDFRLLLDIQQKMLEQTRFGDVDHLERMMLEFIRFGLEHPHHYEIMFMIKDSEMQRYSRTEQAQCLDLFAAVVRAVIVDKPDSASKTYSVPWSLFMSLHGFISYSIQFGQTYEEVRKLAKEHVHNLCHGIL